MIAYESLHPKKCNFTLLKIIYGIYAIRIMFIIVGRCLYYKIHREVMQINTSVWMIYFYFLEKMLRLTLPAQGILLIWKLKDQLVCIYIYKRKKKSSWWTGNISNWLRNEFSKPCMWSTSLRIMGNRHLRLSFLWAVFEGHVMTRARESLASSFAWYPLPEFRDARLVSCRTLRLRHFAKISRHPSIIESIN